MPHELVVLMARLERVIDKFRIKKEAQTRAQERALESVKRGLVEQDVKKIFTILKRVRGKFDLEKGDTSVWRDYVIEAVKTFKSQIKRTNLKPPIPIQIHTIENAYNVLPSEKAPLHRATFTIVQGVDALILPKSRLANNSIMQVASQFNFLESKTVRHTAIDKYIDDVTQGPRASLSTLSSLLLRHASFKSKDPNAGFFINTNCYDGGYFMPWRLTNERQAGILAQTNRNIGQLNILAQWGIPDTDAAQKLIETPNDHDTTHPEDWDEYGIPNTCSCKLLQIFTAAPSYQDAAEPPAANSNGHKLCLLLVTSQYRAIAQIAAIRSTHTQDRVPLHLTLVGQGALKNRGSVMVAAFQTVYDTIIGFPVDVYLHGYTADDVTSIRANVPRSLGTLTTMHADAFFSA